MSGVRFARGKVAVAERPSPGLSGINTRTWVVIPPLADVILPVDFSLQYFVSCENTDYLCV